MKKATKTTRCGLIIQPGAIGDVILTIPLIRMLRKREGLDHVDMMGRQERMALLKGRCELGGILSMEQPGLHRMFEDSNTFTVEKGDELIDLFRPYEVIVTFLKDNKGHFEQNLIFTTLHTHTPEVMTLELRPHREWQGHTASFYLHQFCEQKLRESGIVREMTLVQEKMQLVFLQEFMEGPLLIPQRWDVHRGREILIREGIDPESRIMAVHPGSGGLHKCWSLKEFCELAEILGKMDYEVIFLWGPAEQDRMGEQARDELATVGKVAEGLILEEVAGLIGCCAGFVGNDSGISHLAGALDKPTVAVFGGTNSRHWRPLGSQVQVCQTKEGRSDWPKVEEVVEAVQEIMKKSRNFTEKTGR